jgi:hypothetical protein
MRLTALILATTLAPWVSRSAIDDKAPQKPKWMLRSFLQVSATDPTRLLNIADRLFSDERLRMTSVEPSLAFEWQHRLAMVSALSDLFDPSPDRQKSVSVVIQTHARRLLRKALIDDPSLLVRDGAVEAIRRILRMQSSEKVFWSQALELAFLNPKNIVQGEGLFIRETILTVMRESALQPSEKIRRAALKDKNEEVKSRLRAWNRNTWDKVGG